MRKTGLRATALLLAGSLALAGCASDDDGGDSDSSGGSSGGGGRTHASAWPTTPSAAATARSTTRPTPAPRPPSTSLGGEVQEFTPNEDGSDRAEGLANLAEQGYDPVIAVGFAYADTIAEVAADFPDTTFAVVDSSGRGAGPEQRDRPRSSPRSRAPSSPASPPR